ncbi:MAG: butyrate kinase [Candidatus Krumholzibacteria bacterium]|jgi:butyrate kinase|nr:butyrate kinase [Candidatus Krumholzibacteria bacterium]MDP6797492.1 butyrate kinase [Candidatus Krumholzibacteria bacterium]MDP7021514.1 butyrate kinase [Candidatus Krumholzibacteria bacterium]
MPSILVINPGSTSTKIALFSEEGILVEESLEHDASALRQLPSIAAQLSLRKQTLLDFLERHNPGKLDMIVGRGGPLRPLEGGTWIVNREMADDLRSARYGEHASLLGGLLALDLAEAHGTRACVVDPVTVDEMDDVARVSGVKGIERRGRGHALNLKAVCRQAAEELGKPLEETRLIAAHLGGGISVALMRGGKIRDINDGLLGMGPFSANRAGALPLSGILDLAFAPGQSRSSLEKQLSSGAGLYSYLGTADLREIEKRIEEGDEEARFHLEAMAYQIAKEIGAGIAALQGKVDGIVLTGGMSRCEFLMKKLRDSLSSLAPLFHSPGEKEMEALGLGALRVLKGEEEARVYQQESGSPSGSQPPRSFEDLIARLSGDTPRRVAVAGAAKASVIEALARASHRGIVEPLLLGPEDKIRELCGKAGLENPLILDIPEDDETLAKAAVREVREGRAQILMKGSLSTSSLLKAVLHAEEGLRGDGKLSHVALLESRGRWMLHTDGGINVEQDLETRKSILSNAVALARRLEIPEPAIAGLALVENENKDLPETLDMKQLALWVEEGALGDARMEGPLALDVAFSRESADSKGSDSKLSGCVDIFLGPNITATNFVVKALLDYRQVKVGGLVLGARVPIVLLSRSDSPETRLYSLALGAYCDSPES